MSRTETITFYVQRSWQDDIELEISNASFTPARRGRTNCLPEHAYPDEPAELELGEITCNGKPWVDPDGKPCELTESEEEAAKEELFEKCSEDDRDYDPPDYDD